MCITSFIPLFHSQNKKNRDLEKKQKYTSIARIKRWIFFVENLTKKKTPKIKTGVLFWRYLYLCNKGKKKFLPIKKNTKKWKNPIQNDINKKKRRLMLAIEVCILFFSRNSIFFQIEVICQQQWFFSLNPRFLFDMDFFFLEQYELSGNM